MPTPPPPPLPPVQTINSNEPRIFTEQELQKQHQDKILIELRVESYLQPLKSILHRSESFQFTGQQMKDIVHLHRRLSDNYQLWKQGEGEFEQIVDTTNALKAKLDIDSNDVRELDQDAFKTKFKIGPKYMKILRYIKNTNFMKDIIDCYFKYHPKTNVSVVQLVDWIIKVEANPSEYAGITVQSVKSMIGSMGDEMFKENFISHFKNIYRTDQIPQELIQDSQALISAEERIQTFFGSYQAMWNFTLKLQACPYDQLYEDAIAFVYVLSSFTADQWQDISTYDWCPSDIKYRFDTAKTNCEKPYLNVEFDTLKLYFTAHGTKSQNLIINLNDDGFLTDNSKKLSQVGIENETEISFFKLADYNVFKANPEIKWE
ncbi:hypothetical protein HK103_002329 [Boothiomyces macroporosus]|uniref:Uncharacterized protein n=1 Tax=Boothiomyces macroporosus TaxID=261099 RepID=A0AAD5Y4T2_9FUNG|nr:hypothetical protein HK103_002306 [Boothiomyces macroporosus]KAJ3259426.1 hypothetical protein HK103_002329 [Boothiomyces macroporosus]